jgi:hypothetical protein
MSIAGLIQSACAPAADGHSSLVRVVYAGTLYNMRDTIVGDTDVVAVCLAAIDDVCIVCGAMPRVAHGSSAPIVTVVTELHIAGVLITRNMRGRGVYGR